jgi:hypothetical protein
MCKDLKGKHSGSYLSAPYFTLPLCCRAYLLHGASVATIRLVVKLSRGSAKIRWNMFFYCIH